MQKCQLNSQNDFGGIGCAGGLLINAVATYVSLASLKIYIENCPQPRRNETSIFVATVMKSLLHNFVHSIILAKITNI